MFREAGHARGGDNDGLTRYTHRHAERPARVQQSDPASRRRNVADDHGDPGPAGLQGGQAYQRRPKRHNAGARPLARWQRNGWKRWWWKSRRWEWRSWGLPQG